MTAADIAEQVIKDLQAEQLKQITKIEILGDESSQKINVRRLKTVNVKFRGEWIKVEIPIYLDPKDWDMKADF